MRLNDVEIALVEATWTLRRLPDPERAVLYRSNTFWPDHQYEYAGSGDPDGLYRNEPSKFSRPTGAEIDAMQPALDLLQAIPDLQDRRLTFWAAWHQCGEPGGRIPWARVRRALGVSLSRWTLKRRYVEALDKIVTNSGENLA